MSSLYGVSIENLKGIGKKRAELFNRLGVYSVGDLLEFYPRRYENPLLPASGMQNGVLSRRNM